MGAVAGRERATFTPGDVEGSSDPAPLPGGSAASDSPGGQAATAPAAAVGEEPAEPTTAGALPESERINDAQRQKLFATARDLALSQDDVATIVERLYGQPTTKSIPRGELDRVLGALADEHAKRAGVAT